MNNKVSIIIPCRNEEKYIPYCLDSLLKNDYPKDLLEIIIVDGMSEDKTPRITKKYSKKYSFIKILKNKNKITSTALNIGIKSSNGNYIMILSAHSFYPKNYISKIIKWHKLLNADCIGATLEPEIINNNKKSFSIKKVISNIFGVGTSYFRIGTKEAKIVDTVAYGCYKREIFNKIGLFNKKLIRNQDIELNKKIVLNGGKIYLIPDVKCKYYIKENYKELAKSSFNNGLWNILTIYYTKNIKSLSLRHFVPLFFLLSLFILPFLSFIKLEFLFIPLTILLIYNFLIFIFSIKLIDYNSNLLYLLLTFYTLHFSYGFGSITGIIKLILIIFSKNKK